MSWYFLGGFSAYLIVPSGRQSNHCGCSLIHGWSGEHWTATVEPLDDHHGRAYIQRIDVDEGFRGQGIGTAAIRGIAQEYRAVYLCPDNEDAARLYARIGEQLGACPLECLYYLDQGYGVYEVA